MSRGWLRIAAKGFGILLVAAIAAANYCMPVRQIAALPDVVRLAPGETYMLPASSHWILGGQDTVPARQSSDESLVNIKSKRISYRLLGILPFRSIEVVQTDAVHLIPGGDAVGITIQTDGVLVVGLGAVDTVSGSVSPAAAAGMEPGDWILSVNGSSVDSSLALAKHIASGETKNVEIERDGVRMSLLVRPVQSTEGIFRLGAWVRDSTAGVGTLSFFDPSSGWFAALGHPVSDVDTQQTLTVSEGKLVPSNIVDVIRGSEGMPGELMGVFSSAGMSLGSIKTNTEYGIFGESDALRERDSVTQIPMGYAFEAHVGTATLLSTISERGVESFSCEVTRVSTQDTPSTKGMVIEITDVRLLEETGGIVQGMSGSPILQDGKLIGVVTHVFVNDPTRGYCIYAEWMHEKLILAASNE